MYWLRCMSITMVLLHYGDHSYIALHKHRPLGFDDSRYRLVDYSYWLDLHEKSHVAVA